MKQDVIDRIIEFFEAHDDVFEACIEELDSYNGYLNDDRYYSMEELDDLFSGDSVTNILNRAYFGYDEETWTTDSSGNKVYGAFNPNRDYFTFNGYGNLVSADYKDYTAFLDSYAIESMSENRRYIYTISECEELEQLFDELEEVA